MLNEYRAEGTHFQLAAKTMSKLFQSDDDEALCDGSQLASEVAEGMRDSAWPEHFTHIPYLPTRTADGSPSLSGILYCIVLKKPIRLRD